MILSSNILRNIRESYLSSLSGIYEREEIIGIFRMLCYEYLGLKPAMTIISLDESISSAAHKKMEYALRELLKNKPIQYILGKADFFDMTFRINPDVLIPRPETEELVNWILEEHKDGSPGSILDIGTGSGCIAISLKKRFKDAEVSGLDVSDSAISCSAENALLNDTQIKLVKADILDRRHWSSLNSYDLIVSNPPYVRHSEKKYMRPNVLDYEPSAALFVSDDDPMFFYDKIMEFSLSHLNPGGKIYFELNEVTGRDLPEFAGRFGYEDVEIRTDLNGKVRLGRIRNFR